MGRGFVSIIIIFLGFLGLSLVALGSTALTAENNQLAVIKRSSSAIAITKDGTTLLAVNPDSNSLTIIDTDSLVTTEIPVGLDPRTVAVNDSGREVYVANRGSNTVSVVDVTSNQVVGEIPVGERPYSILASPGGEFLYVTEQGANRLRILDVDTWGTVRLISTVDRPSGLAVRADGQKVYITHLLTNEITVLDARFPYSSYLPTIINSIHGANGTREIANSEQPFSNDKSPISTIALWPDSNLIHSFILSPDGKLAYIAHTRSNTSNRALTFDTTVFPLVSIIDVSSQQHLVGQQLDLGTVDPPGVGLPFDAAVTPDGKELWVLNAASNDITVINLQTRQRAAHIEVGDNPRGIVLAPDGATAYVNNSLAGTVSIIDTAAYQVESTITTTTIPLVPLLLEGKRLFHSSDDSRLSKDQWISCNTCHFDGEHDGRTWFFGFAGPRNTTSLLGMIQTYPLRWSGEWDESADSEFAIRKENFGAGLVEGDMHCALSPPDCVDQPPNQGRDHELDALAAFIDSLAMPLSPPHAQGEPLNAAEQRGQALFNDRALGCIECHPPPYYTDLQTHNVGTATNDEKIGPAYDTPGLRSLYNSAPYFHDGSAETLYDTLIRPSQNSEHDLRGKLSESEIQDLIAFLRALPFKE